ncbi:MAG TPA: glutamate mutase L [Anaerolineaceae bacterium]|nr:glutamate mutase L [Anaerolineaceae bacterium]
MEQKTYLSIDIGSQRTRAWLFQQREGYYQLAGSATAQTTVSAGQDVRAGVRHALLQLQQTSGIQLLDTDQRLIQGMQGVAGTGITVSAGYPLRTALIGVSADLSLASLRRLVDLFYTDVVLELDLQDELNPTAQLEKLIQSDADLYVIAGGTDGGSYQPVRAALENMRIVYQSLPRVIRPQVVYAGNSDLAEEARAELEAGPDFHLAGNIHPRLGVETLSAAWQAMLEAFAALRRQQLRGLEELEQECNATVLPTAFAMSRIVRLIDRIHSNGKGTLALDVGSSSTTVLAAHGDEFIGSINRPEISSRTGEETCRWSSLPIDVETASIYMLNKRLHPAFLPDTLEDLAIEHAWTRVRLQAALKHTQEIFPNFAYHPEQGLFASYEPILLSGESLIRVPAAQQSLLIALDGLRPHGITTFTLDERQLMAALGALAELEPLLAVQMIDAGAFVNLGTVITAESTQHASTSLLTLEVDREEAGREKLEVRKGTLKRIEAPQNQRTRIYLSPSEFTDVGMGYVGLGGWVTVPGSKVGVVIDGRGRPLELPQDAEQRSQTIYNWLWELGG